MAHLWVCFPLVSSFTVIHHPYPPISNLSFKSTLYIQILVLLAELAIYRLNTLVVHYEHDFTTSVDINYKCGHSDSWRLVLSLSVLDLTPK
jgi:hypothetical protein